MAKPEKLKYGGIEQTVEEPLNPASYTVRPMIFSESEMDYYGLKETDLTKVEKAIIKTSRDIRNDWLDLVNYYTLDDVVLNTSAAMTATFDFNKNFSQNGINQTSIRLEPQGYELKAFGFDAYLRMILQNATGESIAYNQKLKSDIYEIVAEKDGTATVVALWILSFVFVYLIPTAQVIILCTLMLAMILSVLASFIRGDKKYAKTFFTECLSPFLTVLVINFVTAFIVSTLMGNGGFDLVTGDLTNSQSFSSPKVTIIFLLIASLVAVCLYFIALTRLFKGFYNNAKLVSVPVKASIESLGGATLGLTSKLQGLATGEGIGKGSKRKVKSKGVGNGTSLEEQSRSNLGSSLGKGRGRFKQLFNRRSVRPTMDSSSLKDGGLSEQDKLAKEKLHEALRESEKRKNSDGSFKR